MKKIIPFVLLLFCLNATGCSMPAAAKQGHIYSFIKEEKKSKSMFSKKYESIKDFRGIEMYDEDIDALKEEVKEYIVAHPELSDAKKKDLRELKVMQGETKEEVRLLLGSPDKIVNPQTWVYKISTWRAFTVFIVPVFFVHEGYYLYFKDDILTGIEKHYLKQLIEQSAGPGVYEKKGSNSESLK